MDERIDLDFTNPVGTGGVLGMCLYLGCGGVGGVCGECIEGLDHGLGGWDDSGFVGFWSDRGRSWLMDQKRDDRTPPTNKGQGSE